MCNQGIRPMYTPHTTTTVPPKPIVDPVQYIAFGLSMAACIILTAIISGWMYYRYRKREKNRLYALTPTDSYLLSGNMLHTFIGHSSGSGSGIPLLVKNIPIDFK